MRKLFLTIGLSLLMTTTIFAKAEQVTVGGKQLTLAVQEQLGRKLYPLRAVCNALDINIVSVDENKIQLQQGDNTVYYFLGQKLVGNDTGYFTTDVAPMSVNNTVYVPIRTISYMFGYNIDTSNGMSLSKVANFTQPKATYASYLLMKDITITNEIVAEVDPSYYLSALKGALSNYSWSHISNCKEYILEDKLTISEMATKLKTQSGKAVYNATVEFLDATYDTFCNIEMFDITGAMNGINRVASASSKLMSKRDMLVEAVYAVASPVK